MYVCMHTHTHARIHHTHTHTHTRTHTHTHTHKCTLAHRGQSTWQDTCRTVMGSCRTPRSERGLCARWWSSAHVQVCVHVYVCCVYVYVFISRKVILPDQNADCVPMDVHLCTCKFVCVFMCMYEYVCVCMYMYLSAEWAYSPIRTRIMCLWMLICTVHVQICVHEDECVCVYVYAYAFICTMIGLHDQYLNCLSVESESAHV
jgi:hypothetical protein